MPACLPSFPPLALPHPPLDTPTSRPAPPSPQVIIERMDRLKPRRQLCLKVASIMGQWVDLDILHKYYPINRTR